MPLGKRITDSGRRSTEDIPDLCRPLLAEKVSMRDVEAGQPIGQVGDAEGKILCLVSGGAQVVQGDFRTAQEVIVESIEQGDVFGDLAFLTGRRWPLESKLVATAPTTVMEISMAGFQRVLRENPDFTVALLKSLGKKTVRVDRREFSSPAQVKEGAAAVCKYPSHPGLDDDLQSRFQQLAFSNESVLIVGETGVGKDILAYAIFDAADRNNEVLVPINVRKLGTESFFLDGGSKKEGEEQSLSTQQIRALFGYAGLGPDGAERILPGYLDLAHEGTLFIRGAHLLTAVAQQKLLDAWRTGAYCPPGSGRRIEVDLRLICTTELDVDRFSADRHPLLWELQETALIVPPLRRRRDRIPALARHYMNHYAEEMDRQAPEPDELTVKALTDYSWPGNDLELANAMRRAVVVSPGDRVRRQDLTFESLQTSDRHRYDLLRLGPIRQAMVSPLFPAILQSAFVPAFLAIILLLFFGPPDPSKNLAAVVMWSLAWPGLIVGAFLGARISCSICAIGALSKLAKRIVSLELPFPEVLRMRSDFLIAAGILSIIWIECVSDIRSSPFNLGLLLLCMFIIAFVLNTLFVRQTWCRYLCPLGGMTGLFARTSVLELRADNTVCLSKCSSHECYYGTKKAEGCAFGQVAATLHSNQFCKVCGNCVKNCPYDAVRLNLRIPGTELGEVRHVRTGTGFLVLSLNGALLSDILIRVPWYDRLVAWLPGSHGLKFTLLYLGSILIVNSIAIAAASVSQRAFRERLFENYARFALSLLPLTCMGFLAFHAYYLLTLGPRALTLLGEYFGVAMLSGPVAPIPNGIIQMVQQALIAVGLVWTLIIIYALGQSSPRGRVRRRWGVLPHVLVAVGFALFLVATLGWAFPR